MVVDGAIAHPRLLATEDDLDRTGNHPCHFGMKPRQNVRLLNGFDNVRGAEGVVVAPYCQTCTKPPRGDFHVVKCVHRSLPGVTFRVLPYYIK